MLDVEHRHGVKGGFQLDGGPGAHEIQREELVGRDHDRKGAGGSILEWRAIDDDSRRGAVRADPFCEEPAICVMNSLPAEATWKWTGLTRNPHRVLQRGRTMSIGQGMILLPWVPPGQSALAERPPPREGYNSDPVTNNIGLPASSDSLTVVAIVAAYNEADIIDQVVRDLITQGVQVYLLDDGSTDGTVEAVEHYVGSGVVGIERLEHGEGDAGARFYWERILFRKAQIAQHIDATWFIHHDADEFRESPWFGVPLREAIAQVDRLGFNAIDAASFDFWPVDDSFGPGVDVRVALP